MKLETPLLDGETIIESEVLYSFNEKSKAITNLALGIFCLSFAIFLLMQNLFESEFLPILAYILLCGMVIFLVRGVYYLKYSEEKDLFITNYRLVEQSLCKDKPVNITDTHYEFFESTYTHYFQSSFPKSALLFFVCAGLILIGILLSIFGIFFITNWEWLFNWYLMIGFAILGIIMIFSQKHIATIPFQIKLASNQELKFNFSVKRMGQERIYKLINQIITQSRMYINKVSI